MSMAVSVAHFFSIFYVADGLSSTVDFLVAVEVRNMIFRRFKADISIFDILSPMPLVKLAAKIVSKSQFIRAEVVAMALEEIVEQSLDHFACREKRKEKGEYLLV